MKAVLQARGTILLTLDVETIVCIEANEDEKVVVTTNEAGTFICDEVKIEALPGAAPKSSGELLDRQLEVLLHLFEKSDCYTEALQTMSPEETKVARFEQFLKTPVSHHFGTEYVEQARAVVKESDTNM